MNTPRRHGLVQAFRGPLLENQHLVSVAVVAPGGRLLASCGQPATTMVLRSTAKPFQAQAMFFTDAITRLDVSPAELALACASHDSTQRHTDAVGAWLRRLQLSVQDLGCGPHLPGNPSARTELIRSIGAPTPIHNNCSGKHAGMLAACRANGWDTATYLDPEHPLQRWIRATLEAIAGETPQTGATDGCGAPTFGLSVVGTATLYAALAAPEAAPAAHQEGLAAAFSAMRQYPELVAGPTTLDTILMQSYRGLVCKRGADGGYGMALRETARGPLGVALWVHDGSAQARASAVLDVLSFAGLTPVDDHRLDRLDGLTRRNCREIAIGGYEAHLALSWTE